MKSLAYMVLISVILVYGLGCSVSLDDFYEQDLASPTSGDHTQTTYSSKPIESSTESSTFQVSFNFALPVVVLNGAPTEGETITVNSVTITVEGVDVTHYRYRLDGGSFSEETDLLDPIVLTELTNGQHILSVIGKNANGVWQSSPTVLSWYVNTSKPVAVFEETPAAIIYENSASFVIGGVGVIAYQYNWNSYGYSEVRTIENQSSLILTGLTHGDHTLSILGQNSAGNWQSEPTTFSWSVDLSAPEAGDPPTGTITINNQAEYATNTNVNITINGEDHSGGSLHEMRFKINEGTWTAWEPYNTSKALTLDSEDGVQTVYCKIIDSEGEISEMEISDTIHVDLNDPTGSMVINNDDPSTSTLSVTLTITASDGTDGSGLSDMQFSTDNGTWSDWVAYVSTHNYEIEPGPYGVRNVAIRIRDNSGRISATIDDTISHSGDMIYVADWGNNGWTGLDKLNPKLTINAGISEAIAQSRTQVAVASGTYSEQVTLQTGISVFGGFSSDFNDRDPAGYVTIVTTPGGSDCPMTADSSISNTTIVDGLSLEAPGTSATDTYGFKCDGGSPILKNMLVSNSCTSSVTNSYGVFISNSGAPEFTNLDIAITNTNSTNNIGIHLDVGTQAQIFNGDIYINNQNARGVQMNGSTEGTRLEGLSIRCSSTTQGWGINMENNSKAHINRCFIHGGNNTGNNKNNNIGIRMYDSFAYITNSVVYGTYYNSTYPTQIDTVAIYLNNSSPVISNNNIFGDRKTPTGGGCDSPNGDMYIDRFGIFIDTGSPYIINNIFDCSRSYSTYRGCSDDTYLYEYAIYENTATSSPNMLINNLFISDSKYYYYHDENGIGNMNNINSLNNSDNTTQSIPSSATNNMEQSVGDIYINSETDWNLKSSALAIDAGYNTSPSTFGDITMDYAESTRTEPYDIGAFEY